MAEYDVIIVGAGPAGLNAALMLGRACRNVLICDSGQPRNWATGEMHGFLTRDCFDPTEFRTIGREQLKRYPNVEFRDVLVTDAVRDDHGFKVYLDGGEAVRSRKLLLATGVCDRLPEIRGFAEIYGKSGFHCPYCDGWERRGQRFAVYGPGRAARALALELLGWSKDIIIFTDGPAELDEERRDELERNSISIVEDRIASLESRDGALQAIVLESGESLGRDAFFFATPADQACGIAEALGCVFTKRGDVDTNDYERSSVPGVYVAGDASRHVELVIVAAAEGAMAAFAINAEILAEDRL